MALREKETQRTYEESGVWIRAEQRGEERGEGGMSYGVRCCNPMLSERG